MRRHDALLEERWRRWGFAIFILVGICSAYFTFMGMRVLMDVAPALLITAITIVFPVVVWSILSDALTKVERRRDHIVLVGALGILGICATSTLSAWVGMAGTVSQAEHMRQTIDDATEVLARQRELHRREQQLAPVFTTTSQTLGRVSSAERSYGSRTGYGGPGPVSGGIATVAQSYGDGVSLLQAADTAAQQNFERAEELIRNLRLIHTKAVTATSSEMRELNRRFESKLLELNDILAATPSALPALQAAVGQTDGAIDALTDVGGAGVSTTVSKLVHETKRRVEGLAKGGDQAPVPVFRTISPMNATFEYADRYPSLLVYCTVFDLVLPASMVLAAIIFAPRRREEDDDDEKTTTDASKKPRHEATDPQLPAEQPRSNGQSGNDARVEALVAALQQSRSRPS